MGLGTWIVQWGKTNVLGDEPFMGFVDYDKKFRSHIHFKAHVALFKSLLNYPIIPLLFFFFLSFYLCVYSQFNTTITNFIICFNCVLCNHTPSVFCCIVCKNVTK